MGIGSYIALINATPWTWTLSSIHEYQMNTWSFPDSIEAGTSVRVYVEENDSIFITQSDDGADVSYEFSALDTTLSFQLAYIETDDGPAVNANFTNLATLNNADDSVLGLYWRQDNASPWIIGSNNDQSTTTLVSSNPPENWMEQTYDRIQCLKLREFCMPGTHDSGMSQFNGHTAGVLAENTVTQLLDVYDQLQNGARFFDIRPTIAGGDYVTGHYSYTGNFGWQGADGESISSIITSINDFTADYNELIILSLSHPLNSDDFPDDGTYSFSQDQWNALFTQLEGLNDRIVNDSPDNDISQNTVGDYINGRSAVLILVGDDSVDLSDWYQSGFYESGQFPSTGTYANSDDYDTIVTNQLSQLVTDRTSPDDAPFVLSWQWTIQASNLLRSITDFAQGLNSLLWDDLWGSVNSNTYPNVILVDAYPSASRPMAALAMSINYYLAPTC